MSEHICITIFPDVFAQRAICKMLTIDELAQRIERPREYDSKSDCPLIKMARFGDLRSHKNSLRHDANVLAVTGIEGDHDAGTMTLEQAAELLSFAGIAALFYTSPSHRPEHPRWRALAPFSKEYPPTQRRRFAARLNGVLHGALSSESFTLSQSYYIGRVNGSPYQSRRIDGQFLDLLDELDSQAKDGGRRDGESRAEKTREARDNDPVVRRLRELGMVKRDRMDGGADIHCPFESQHTTQGAAGDTTYFPPHTGGYARGHFHCLHSHCAHRSDGDFLAVIGIGEREARQAEIQRKNFGGTGDRRLRAGPGAIDGDSVRGAALSSRSSRSAC